LAGVQVLPDTVSELARFGNFRVMMEDFGARKMSFACEQHSHHKAVCPAAVPKFPPGSRHDGFVIEE